MVLERTTGKTTNLTESLDRHVNSFTWTPESTSLFFTTGDRGRQNIQLIPVTGGAARAVAAGDSELDDMQLTRDGKTMVYTEQTGAVAGRDPARRVLRRRAGALTHLNDAVLNSHQLTPLEEFWANAPDGARVHSFVVKPYGSRRGGSTRS